jgi:hypothetical protein
MPTIWAISNYLAFGKLMVLAAVRTCPLPVAGSDNADCFCLIQAISTKGKTTITTPCKSFLLGTDKAWVKLFYGTFSGPYGTCIHIRYPEKIYFGYGILLLDSTQA